MKNDKILEELEELFEETIDLNRSIENDNADEFELEYVFDKIYQLIDDAEIRNDVLNVFKHKADIFNKDTGLDMLELYTRPIRN